MWSGSTKAGGPIPLFSGKAGDSAKVGLLQATGWIQVNPRIRIELDQSPSPPTSTLSVVAGLDSPDYLTEIGAIAMLDWVS